MTRLRIISLVAALAWGIAAPAGAAEPLVSDRPDFTESATVVDRGRLQLEGGATFARTQDGVEATTIGELLGRWGVARGLELRLGFPTWERVDDGRTTTDGLADLVVGAKVQLATARGDGFFPGADWALVVATTVPTGGDEVTADAWQPTATLCGAWELGGDWSVGANLGLARLEDDDQRVTSVWASGALGVALSEATSAFFELVVIEREERRGPSTVTLQTGITHLLSDDLQLDALVARRLTDEGPDFLVGFGVSTRF